MSQNETSREIAEIDAQMRRDLILDRIDWYLKHPMQVIGPSVGTMLLGLSLSQGGITQAKETDVISSLRAPDHAIIETDTARAKLERELRINMSPELQGGDTPPNEEPFLANGATTTHTNIRASSSTDSEILSVFETGTPVQVVARVVGAENSLWWKIQLADGSFGYISVAILAESALVPTELVGSPGITPAPEAPTESFTAPSFSGIDAQVPSGSAYYSTPTAGPEAFVGKLTNAEIHKILGKVNVNDEWMVLVQIGNEQFWMRASGISEGLLNQLPQLTTTNGESLDLKTTHDNFFNLPISIVSVDGKDVLQIQDSTFDISALKIRYIDPKTNDVIADNFDIPLGFREMEGGIDGWRSTAAVVSYGIEDTNFPALKLLYLDLVSIKADGTSFRFRAETILVEGLAGDAGMAILHTPDGSSVGPMPIAEAMQKLGIGSKVDVRIVPPPVFEFDMPGMPTLASDMNSLMKERIGSVSELVTSYNGTDAAYTQPVYITVIALPA